MRRLLSAPGTEPARACKEAAPPTGDNAEKDSCWRRVERGPQVRSRRATRTRSVVVTMCSAERRSGATRQPLGGLEGCWNWESLGHFENSNKWLNSHGQKTGEEIRRRGGRSTRIVSIIMFFPAAQSPPLSTPPPITGLHSSHDSCDQAGFWSAALVIRKKW